MTFYFNVINGTFFINEFYTFHDHREDAVLKCTIKLLKRFNDELDSVELDPFRLFEFLKKLKQQNEPHMQQKSSHKKYDREREKKRVKKNKKKYNLPMTSQISGQVFQQNFLSYVETTL